MKRILLGLIILSLAACKKHQTPIPLPGRATLYLPAQNNACTTGTDITASSSTVMFKWNASLYTGGYELRVTNLLNQVQLPAVDVPDAQASVSLLLNTPYSWYVISKAQTGSDTTHSTTWKFYNAGPGATNYAPYPAESSYPSFGVTVASTGGNVQLEWIGSTVNNVQNIVNYDVYFGTSATPPLFKSKLPDYRLNVPVTSGSQYFWQIITRDTNGNTSASDIFEFSVQ